MSDPADLQRLLGDMLRLGTVLSVDHAEATCRVQIGDLETGDIPWLTGAAGATRIWCPPSVGEQVLVAAPEGDTIAGLVLSGLPSDANPAAGDSDRVIIRFGDEAVISYDPNSHELAATLPPGGSATITADAGIKLVGPVEIQGTLRVSEDVQADAKIRAAGEISSDDDVKAGAISLATHIHDKVQAGTALTGGPK